jgi:hypothetical protein
MIIEEFELDADKVQPDTDLTAMGILAPYPEHVGDQFLRHLEMFPAQAIHAQQNPPAQLLIEGVVSVANRRLRHLRDQGLGAPGNPRQTGHVCEFGSSGRKRVEQPQNNFDCVFN